MQNLILLSSACKDSCPWLFVRYMLSPSGTTINFIVLSDNRYDIIVKNNGKKYKRGKMDIQFRLGTVDDAGMIVGLINELAEYEKLPDTITTTEADIRTAIAKGDIETLFASSDGKDVGFAMFLDNYASIFGAKGMFIENLYVRPEYRGNGIGEAIMRELCRIAVSRGYKKVEWHCLEWNEPANQLYLKLNATQKKDWIFYRLFGDTLEELGK